jgi:penicillin-binding protein 1A
MSTSSHSTPPSRTASTAIARDLFADNGDDGNNGIKGIVVDSEVNVAKPAQANSSTIAPTAPAVPTSPQANQAIVPAEEGWFDANAVANTALPKPATENTNLASSHFSFPINPPPSPPPPQKASSLEPKVESARHAHPQALHHWRRHPWLWLLGKTTAWLNEALTSLGIRYPSIDFLTQWINALNLGIFRLSVKLAGLIQTTRVNMRQRGYLGPVHHTEIILSESLLEMRRTLSLFLSLAVAGFILSVALVALVVALIWPKLPSLDQISQYNPILPLQVYSRDGKLIGEYGSEHRTFTPYSDFPPHLIHALISAEDQRFFTHYGFDPIGLGRAVLMALTSGRGQGTSTITQQLARNFYLNQERTIWRKVIELLLAIKIEQTLSKEKILEVYMNHIFMGQRAYGFASAAKTYFDKEVGEITLAESAVLAGLPKFPSVNPMTDPERVMVRRSYTLGRMRQDGHINQAQFEAANAEKLTPVTKGKAKTVARSPDYVAEMARQYLIDLLRTQGYDNPEEIAYSRGFRVTTSIRADWQEAATQAVRKQVIAFEIEHGFRGAESRINLEKFNDINLRNRDIEAQFANAYNDPQLTLAVMLQRNGNTISFYVRGGEEITINIEKDKLLQKFANLPSADKLALRRGAVVRLFKASKKPNEGAEPTPIITQLPQVEAALVAINPTNGRVEALIGGYANALNQFNHITQAYRQPGSTFKPFIYSAAIDRGLGAGDVYLDEPLEYVEANGRIWRPKNYDDTYSGPITVRRALAVSKNTVVVQVMEQYGVSVVHEQLERFGFDPAKVPPVRSLSLGAGEVTPMQMATAYSRFANGGYRVQPWVIEEIRDSADQLYYRYQEESVIRPDNLVVDPRNAYMMDNMLKDVMNSGTAAKVRQEITRNDIAGKTGTTNDYVDAWFAGYQAQLVSVVWLGYDRPARLGRGATGGKLALPIWIDFMKVALKDIPVSPRARPNDIGSFNDDLILREFERDSTPSIDAWDTWGFDPNHDYEGEGAPDLRYQNPMQLTPNAPFDPNLGLEPWSAQDEQAINRMPAINTNPATPPANPPQRQAPPPVRFF